MTTRRSELTRQAARLFAEKGYHGTSIGDLAEAMGVQKGSLYAHISSKQDLLYETMAEGARAFHAGLDAIPDKLPATEKIRLALRSHLQVVADQLDVATVFVQAAYAIFTADAEPTSFETTRASRAEPAKRSVTFAAAGPER